MFTGIVEEIGRVRSLERVGAGVQLTVGAERVLSDLQVGDSIAVDGACLTVTALQDGAFTVGLAPETLRRTNLGERQPGDSVNLERAVAVGERLGGHYVQGHVDGVGKVLARVPEGDSLRVTFSAPPDLMRYLVVKGFVCVDGVSLTVTGVAENSFQVALVAYTQQAVTLGTKPVGATVNLEVDVIAKYVERLLEARFGHNR
jgi:riboflavin synthase